VIDVVESLRAPIENDGWREIGYTTDMPDFAAATARSCFGGPIPLIPVGPVTVSMPVAFTPTQLRAFRRLVTRDMRAERRRMRVAYRRRQVARRRRRRNS
jgi:hypothetical protein